MSRVFRIGRVDLVAPRYREMLDACALAVEFYKQHPVPETATVAQLVDYNIETLRLWLPILRSAWDELPESDAQAELWLTDQGYALHDMITLGSGVLNEYRRRLGFVVQEKVKAEADFTPPSTGA